MNARISAVSRTLLVASVLCPPTLAMAQSQAWDTKISGSKRFAVLADFNKEAVLDRETGLVWERTPDPGPGSWSFIDDECFAHFTGGRLGWRPPTIEEVLSLMDPLQNLTGKLPEGHPFDVGDSRLTPRQFWTMTSSAVQPANNDFRSARR